MRRTKRIAIGMLLVIGLDLAISFLIPVPYSLIITPVLVVLVLDWLWNRSKNAEYPQDENGTLGEQQKKSDT